MSFSLLKDRSQLAIETATVSGICNEIRKLRNTSSCIHVFTSSRSDIINVSSSKDLTACGEEHLAV